MRDGDDGAFDPEDPRRFIGPRVTRMRYPIFPAVPPPDIGSLAAGLDALGARGGRVHRLIRRARAPRLRRARFAIRRFRPPALLDDRPPRHEPKRGGR